MTTTTATPLLANTSTSRMDLEKGPISWRTRPKLWWSLKPLSDPRVRRPLCISLGLLPVICFISIFFGFTSKAPGLPLPGYLVPLIRAQPQSAAMGVSAIATIIATYVSFLFSSSVRYVMSVVLATRSISLTVFSFATNVAQGTLWLHNLRVKWVWIALVAYVGINIQTAALNSLLTVREITVTERVYGHDVDMTSSGALQVARFGIPDAYWELSRSFLENIMRKSLLFESNISNTFSFNGYTYLTTTGGVQPASFMGVHINDLTDKPNLISPPNLQDIKRKRDTLLPFNQTMHLIQQGLSADVDCKTGDLQTALTTYQASLENLGTSMNLTWMDMAVRCPATNQTDRLDPVVFDAGNPNTGAVFANACQVPNTTSWDIIFRATSPYQILDGTICKVTPQVTTVNVTYTTSQGSQLSTLHVSKPVRISNESPAWGRPALSALLFIIFQGQSTIGNTLANEWLLNVDPRAIANLTFVDVMNIYIKAEVEFFGTVVRQLFTQPNSIFFQGGWDGISDSMKTPINGVFVGTTYGWHQERRISPLFLLPTTATIIATYAMLACGVSLAIKHKDRFNKEDAEFDITNFVHVTAAYRPETRLRSDFRTFSDQSNAYLMGTRLGLTRWRGMRVLGIASRQHEHAYDKYGFGGGDTTDE